MELIDFEPMAKGRGHEMAESTGQKFKNVNTWYNDDTHPDGPDILSHRTVQAVAAVRGLQRFFGSFSDLFVNFQVPEFLVLGVH